MASSRHTLRPQSNPGSDTFENNNTTQVIGLMLIPIQQPVTPGGILTLELGGKVWTTNQVTVANIINPNEVEFNYRFQGGF
jgi:hypothetical protein